MTLDTADRYVLACALDDLVTFAPMLDELVTPTQAASGTNAGRGVSLRGSRPPVNMGALSVKMDGEVIVGGWAECLVEATGLHRPEIRRIVNQARFLRREVDLLQEMDFARDALDELVSCARRIRDLVDPPLSDDEVRPPSPSVDESSSGWVSFSAAERWCAKRGVKVSRRTISSWARAGIISSVEREIDVLSVDAREVLETAVERHRSGRSRLVF
ncbi:hypothetical protein OS128_05225 [Corynebacterium sp. P5848]|uniref:hypothetical protein n=1 Tax=Corynebacterium marambiense TaxID=2765364 RepID=UPI002260A01D|nr:hypothetical protein [Corynebacterium marambiense]MCX7542312.1 hypothetical protein [Corynebacterium marambiense]